MRIGILTISDLGVIGQRADTSGDAILARARPRENRVAGRIRALAHGPKIGNRQYPNAHAAFAAPCRPCRHYRPLVFRATNGIGTTSAGARLPRTSIVNRVPGLACAIGR